MYIYEGHMGNLFVSDTELDIDQLYCEQCGDYDWLIGYATNKAEAWELLKDHTDIFDETICKNCPHFEEADYSCDCCDECENFLNSGGFNQDYVWEFINSHWDE